MRTGSWLAVVLGLGALAAASWFLARPRGEPPDPPRRPYVLPVTLATVERGELRPRVAVTGTVRASRRAELAFEVAGTVREVLAEDAERVAAGALLARLDRTDEELELAAAEAALALAQREQDLLLAGEREEEKRRLAAVVASARAEEDLARSEVERGERLLESQVVSASEQDRRVSVLAVAEKRRVAAEQELERAQAGTRPEDLAIAAARVDQARARVATARHGLAKTELHAPWEGTVLARHVSTGDHVMSGTPVYELADLEHLEIHVDVPGRVAARVDEHTAARVRLPAPDDRGFETALDALVPAADEDARSFRGILRLGPGDDELELLKPGQFLHVELLLRPLPDAVIVPADCIVLGPDGARVVRARAAPAGQEGLVAELVPVEVEAEEDGRAAVRARDGVLAAGESVLLTGADVAFPGAGLLPSADAAAPAGAPR